MQKKIKILHIINSLQIGGAEKNLVSLCNHLSKDNDIQNYEIHILTIDDISSYYKKYLRNIKTYELNYKKNNSFLVFFRIYKLIKEINPDLIHSWLYASDLLTSAIALLQNRNNILWSIRSSNTMNHLDLYSRIFVRVLALFSSTVPKKIIANSHNGKKDHIKLGYDESKIEVIHNGYNLNTLNRSKNKKLRDKLRIKLGIKKNQTLIGNIGRDHPMKDHFTFVESAFFLRKKNKNIKFLILGKGIKKNQNLLRKIKLNKLEEHIILLEPDSVEINHIYQMLDLFCLTSSDSEGFPNVLVESIINNTLTVSTDVGDSRKIVNQNELIIPIKKPKLIADKLNKIILFNNEKKIELLKNLKDNLSNFSLDLVSKKFLHIYQNTILNCQGNEINEIGLVPLTKDLKSPGDRRRFSYFLQKKKIPFKIIDNIQSHKIVFLTQQADITQWMNEKYSYIIYDLTDSYLSISKRNIKGWLRSFAKYYFGQHKNLYFNYWNLLGRMCKRANLVICSTIEQKKLIEKYNKNVEVILDLKDETVKSTYKKKYDQVSDHFQIVWEGLPQNTYLLKIISSVLIKLSKKYKINLNVITDLKYKGYSNKFYNIATHDQVNKIFKKNRIFKLHKWNLKNYYKIILDSDLAIIPTDLKDNFIAGKPENKLLLFWRLGLPAITSASNAYRRTMKNAQLNNYCYNEVDWYQQIEKLILSKKKRKTIGIAGKVYVEKNYSNKRILDKWDIVYNKILKDLKKSNQV
jgi:glycosyltransferase involved in cell wall biosynthesis